MAAAAAALLAAGLAADPPTPLPHKLKVGFIYVGPVERFRLDLPARGRPPRRREGLSAARSRPRWSRTVKEGPDSERVIEQLARTGHQLIFTTSFGFMDPTVKVAKPLSQGDVRALPPATSARPICRPISGRFYEGRYVLGQIAGKVSKSGVVGYIGSFPIPEVVSGINAFMLGAQSIKPEHQGQDRVGEFLVRSRQGSRRRQGADRPGRRHHRPAHRLAGRRCRSRRAARRQGVRPGLGHDQVRAEGAAHGADQQLGGLLRPAASG